MLNSERYVILSQVDGCIYDTHSSCTNMYFCGYLIGDVTTIHTYLRLRRAFFLIFIKWINTLKCHTPCLFTVMNCYCGNLVGDVIPIHTHLR